MHIVFGLDFDKGSYPDALGNGNGKLGVVHAGPAGLIDLLETRLGLGGCQTPPFIRIAQYLKRLQSFDEPHFFTNSLAAEPWSTAKLLLDWRDQLVLGGWDAQLDLDAPERIQSLAQIESTKSMELAPGPGERINRIRRFLEMNQDTCIRRIDCLEIRDDLPLYLQELFTLLEKSGCNIHCGESLSAEDTDTDLGVLRNTLSGTKTANKEITGDGSLLFLHSENEFEAAEYLSAWLENRNDNSDVVWIKGSDSKILDYRLRAHNLPRLGTDNRSKWRTVLQILPLAISTRWAPFDPQIFFEFLSLPQSPVAGSAARYFKNALLEHPGINGPLWEEAKQRSLQKYSEQLDEKKLEPENQKKRYAKFENDLEFWFNFKLFDPEKGITATAVIDICEQVSSWGYARGNLTGNQVFLSAARLADDVAQVVNHSGFELITKPQISRILDLVYADGMKNMDDVEETADWSVVSKPGQIWGKADTIIWWGFVNAEGPEDQIPWTLAETAWMNKKHVAIEDPSRQKIRKARSWRLPIQFSASRLILVCPEQMGGETVAPHPLWDEIRSLLNLEDSDLQKITVKSKAMYSSDVLDVFDAKIKQIPVKQEAMPEYQPVWQVPAKSITFRDYESFSSMDTLIRCPLAWVFKYIAKIYSGGSSSVPDGNQMVGTLAHKIVEDLFDESRDWQPESAKKRALELFEQMVPQMAAPLLQPGREIEHGRYKASLGNAVYNLIKIIRDSGLQHDESEKAVEKTFIKKPRKFSGRIDLCLKDKDGNDVFWDLKWTNRARYKRQELENDEALQLAAYSWLLAPDKVHPPNVYPPGGYYMLGQGELLSAPCSHLPDTCIVGDIDFKTLWESAVDAYKKHMSSLINGTITAENPEYAEDDNETDGFKLEAKCGWCDFYNICGDIQ